jgi:hypothetical protein
VSAVLTELAESPGKVEQLLALGATRFEATAPLLRRAMNTALTPLLNTLSVAGIVSIPGMMTGQIMGGTPPEQAARYQILLLFAIAGTACASLLVACELAVWAVLDGETHRVKRELLTPRDSENKGGKRTRLFVMGVVEKRVDSVVAATRGAWMWLRGAWIGAGHLDDGRREQSRYHHIREEEEDRNGSGSGSGVSSGDNIEPRLPA